MWCLGLVKCEGMDRFNAICRVVEKRRKRGATRLSIVIWLQSLRGEERIFNALINRLIEDVIGGDR